MKGKIIWLLMILSLNANAQFGTRVEGPVTWANTTLKEGDLLHFKQGTLANGQFRFLFDSYDGKHVDGSDHNLTIKRFMVKQFDGNQIKNYIILSWPYGIGNVNVTDLQGAINSGEVDAINGIPIIKPKPTDFVADELLKLKQLLDSGVLTQQEFDTQKTKLLKQ